MIRPAQTAYLCLIVLTLAACGQESAAPFTNKVWEVRGSSAGAAGSLYVFLSDGTLVITRAGNKPMTGAWRAEADGTITMVEQGLSYRTEILAATKTELRLRSHNPGEPVEITLAPASSP